MGCSPARPLNEPIVVSSDANLKIGDRLVDRLDQRVLGEKFVPAKATQSDNLEIIEAPNILAFDPRGEKKEYDVSGLPHYDSDNVTLNGKWQFLDDSQSEVAFDRDTQHRIEIDFVKGMLRSMITLFESPAVITFKDMHVSGHKTLPEGKKDHFSFPIKRQHLRREAYGWMSEDGTIRPLVREIEDILNFTTGVYTYGFDDAILTIDLKKKVIIDTKTALAKPFLSISL
jgi:hypothetical protein